MIERELAERLKRFVKAELKRAGLGYEELAARLTEMGMKESKATIANKVNRGVFSAIFLIAILKTIGRDTITLSEL